MEFRYRYDTETGLYYLNSRYYNPDWGRFINADGIAAVTGDLLSANMFVYCKNNAVNMSDPSGFRPIYGTGFGSETETQIYQSYATMNIDAYEDSNIMFESEHVKNQNPANLPKHQKGQRRKHMDKGGEKGDARRKPNPNKRRTSNIVTVPTDIRNFSVPEPNLNFGERLILVKGGILLFGGTLVEDVATGGAGIADDGVTLTAGFGMIIKAFAN